MNTVCIKVLLFAKARELSGKKEAELSINSCVTFTELLKIIVEYFSLEPIQNNLVLALNEEYLPVETEVTLKEGDKVAVIPPLSGAEMDYLKLSEERLNIGDIVNTIKSPKCGAISTFIGTTRDTCDGLIVKQLVYQAYEDMAINSMKKVCKELRKKWPEVENVAMYHRLGEVPVTEESIIIAVSSPHRKASLEAVHFAIDTLKSSVPVWKKEEYEEGNSQWKENTECAWSSKRLEHQS